MDVNINKRLYAIKSHLEGDKVRLTRAQNDNERYEEIQGKLDDLAVMHNKVSTYKHVLDLVLTRAKSESTDYKKRRLAFLTEEIRTNMDYIFPNESFIPRIEPSIYRGKEICKLKLEDSLGNLRNPAITEGGLAQQLISFSSSLAVVLLKGGKIFYIDEAFANSSDDNRYKLGLILNKYIKKHKKQIILISQSSQLYEYVDRREIKLSKHTLDLDDIGIKGYLGYVTVDSVKDMEGSIDETQSEL